MTTTPLEPTLASLQPSFERIVSGAQARGIDFATLESSLEALLRSFDAPTSRGDDLTDAEAAYLIDSGAFTAELLAATETAIARGDLARLQQETSIGAIVRTLSAAQVAEKLGIDASSVRHRQAKGYLYGILVGRVRQYPLWQFSPATGQPLPHLAQVVAAFPGEWQPASIEGFMTTPQNDLRTADPRHTGEFARVTPADWLLNGGDPHAVIEILTGLEYL